MQQLNEIPAISADRSPGDSVDTVLGQHHYTADQVAKMWNLSTDTVRRLFHGEDGVLKIVRQAIVTNEHMSHCASRRAF